MKNKKGVTIGRILLYILFISLLGFFIYIIACTFKAIKDKQPTSTSTYEVIKNAYPIPESPNYYYWSATESIDNHYYVFFRDVDPVYQCNNSSLRGSDFTSFISGGFQGDPYKVSPMFNFFAYDSDNGNLIHTGSNYYDYYSSSSQVDDNVLNMSNTLFSDMPSIVNYSNSFEWAVDYINEYNGMFLVYNFRNVPLQYFNFSVQSTSDNVGYHYYVKDNTNRISILSLDSNNNYSFNASNDLTLSPGVNSITQLIFPIFQSYSSSGISYYPLVNPYNYMSNYSYFANSINIDSFNFLINFDYFLMERDSTYQAGYDAGYQKGLIDANESLEEYVTSTRAEFNSLNNTIADLTSRVNQQSQIIDQLNNQLQQSQNNFKGLFFTFADIPFKTVSNALGFEFWGVNLFRFFVGIITALGIVWLIKRII